MKVRIFRNQKVITDSDLAQTLQVAPKSLIAAFKRNIYLFEEEDYFVLSEEERKSLVQDYCFDHAERLRYAKRLPYVFKFPAVIKICCLLKKNQKAKEVRQKFFALPQIQDIDLEKF
jgi:hypothetical protein